MVMAGTGNNGLTVARAVLPYQDEPSVLDLPGVSEALPTWYGPGNPDVPGVPGLTVLVRPCAPYV